MVWAPSKWLDLGKLWVQVRSTASEALHGLPSLEDELVGEAYLHHAVVSIVVDDPSRRSRKLPTLYLATSPVFAHRDLEVVKEKAVEVIETLERSIDHSFYLVSPCRYGSLRGIYCKDLFNRSAFRRQLTRRGMEFDESLFVSRAEDAAIRTAAWGAFRPDFAIFPGYPDGPLRPATQGEVMWGMGIHKLGPQTVEDVAWLARFARNLHGIRTDDAAATMEWLDKRAG